MPQLCAPHAEGGTFHVWAADESARRHPDDRLRAHQIANQAQESLRSDGFRTATVDYDIVPFIGQKVDLHLNIDAGERIRVKQVEFTGDTEFDPKELRGTLHSLKIKRVTPPIPGVWDGWRLYPGYSPESVQGDLALLRSYYMSRGYFDATVKADDVEVAQKAAHVKHSSAGRAAVSRANLAGLGQRSSRRWCIL
jgi:outer membrane protein assembly factor BamA